ncbi:cationic peptide resistance protein CprA [Pseudomonas sp. QL9]|uniref:cationic peptide resistance protein CprA n=1 Tax=Pseudomonas TaxID=286 RepID=UPI003529ED1A
MTPNADRIATPSRRFAAEHSLLLTGATGFLGGAVAACLIQGGQADALLFLVRADSPEQGLERLRDNLRLHAVSETALEALKAAQILCGDLLDTRWLQTERARLMRVEQVINCAAVASFSKNPTIWPVNVEGTFAFARAMSQSRNLKRFLHVGTAMCCGPQRESPVRESWDFPDSEEQLVDYTASKAEIERRMREELPNLPLVVARPSIVVGHRELGCQASGSIFWVFRMGFALESFTCALDEQIDVIPVDYCAEALVALALKPTLAHGLYHISAGHGSSCTFGEIDRAYALARGEEPVGERYRKVSADDLRELAGSFEARIGKANPRLVLRALRLYSGFADLNYLFDNQRLLDEGIAPPPRFTEYVDVCVESSREVSIPAQMLWDFK